MFEELLTKEFNEVNGIKVLSATYDKGSDCLMLSLSYPDGVVLSAEQRERIKEIASKISDVGIKNISVQLKKAYVNSEFALQETKKFIETNYPLLYSFCASHINCNVSDGKAKIEIDVGDDVQDYIKERNISESIKEHLFSKLQIDAVVQFNFTKQEDEIAEPEIEEDILNLPENHRHIKIFNKQKFVGEEITELPMYISDVNVAADNLVICGRINYYQIKEFTTKNGKQRHIAKFVLKDPTGEFHVVMFVSESNYAKMEKLSDGIEIVASGSCEVGKYDNLELKCKNIMLCDIDKNFKEEITFKPEPKTYSKVLPERIDYKEQINLFEQAREVPKFLQDNEIVVFDIETTGLNFTESEIIEIGAIKIKKGGIISEKFSTFVKPKKKVPSEITALTGITNEDVATGVDLETALADFYKFTRNCTLVGHNISFDYGFINYYGKKVGYDFSDSPQQDTYELSHKYLPGMKNYKLKTVAEHFNISLKNAHRAYHDAYATAEVFMKLAEFFK